jgi:hypothetical protein
VRVYRIGDVVRETGLSPETVRRLIAGGGCLRPHGHGRWATYDDGHLACFAAYARFRDERPGGGSAERDAQGRWTADPRPGRPRRFFCERQRAARAERRRSAG